ncbi:putative acetyltransferase [Chlamydia abortus]|jgi:GNAT superfamily N-acetyltransferase|uniref:GNAT family N-acetyltransferase n=1 Tax=Paenibacillus residui TaxID=629724 RepID=A0ABW3DAT3_9BACL|nr:GNAT family N-acetyltransferase [Paenibacillus sp. 32O-W]SHE13115.1 putative acetyltransferase [Chlamydia abortus]
MPSLLQLQHKEDFTPNVRRILEECLYLPDEEKLNKIVDLYLSDSCRFFYAWHDDEEEDARAIIGISVRSETQCAVILHIAVKKEHRGKGIGRQMIDKVIARHAVLSVQAQTDQDSVPFYKSCGFTVTSLGELYPGIERFLCEKRMTSYPICRTPE